MLRRLPQIDDAPFNRKSGLVLTRRDFTRKSFCCSVAVQFRHGIRGLYLNLAWRFLPAHQTTLGIIRMGSSVLTINIAEQSRKAAVKAQKFQVVEENEIGNNGSSNAF